MTDCQNQAIESENVEGELSIEKWLEIRKLAGSKIDPETAEVCWTYAQTLDPYGVDPDLPDELNCIGREYFARSPGSDIWVWFGDLSDEVHHKLWAKHKSNLAFPAGLPLGETVCDHADGLFRSALTAEMKVLRFLRR